MPSDKIKTDNAARHNRVRKITHKLYRTRLEQRCPCPAPHGFADRSRVRPHLSSSHLSNLNKSAASTMMGTVADSDKTRRWPRLPVDMPVRVVTSKGFSTTVVEGRGTEMSEGGMVLYAGILLNPGDLLEIEFDTPAPSRLPAIVRSRNGFCFGLEFITPLPA